MLNLCKSSKWINFSGTHLPIHKDYCHANCCFERVTVTAKHLKSHLTLFWGLIIYQIFIHTTSKANFLILLIFELLELPGFNPLLAECNYVDNSRALMNQATMVEKFFFDHCFKRWLKYETKKFPWCWNQFQTNLVWSVHKWKKWCRKQKKIYLCHWWSTANLIYTNISRHLLVKLLAYTDK